MRRETLVIIVSTALWFIAFALYGAGVVAANPKAFIGGIPVSFLYLLVMGLWGVANSLLTYYLWAPRFYKRAYEILGEEEK